MGGCLVPIWKDFFSTMGTRFFLQSLLSNYHITRPVQTLLPGRQGSLTVNIFFFFFCFFFQREENQNDYSLGSYAGIFEPHRDKTNKVAVRPDEDSDQPGHSPSLIRVFAVRMKSNLESLATHWAHSEDSDQTGRMPRLIWVFAGRTVSLLVLSRGGWFLDFTSDVFSRSEWPMIGGWIWKKKQKKTWSILKCVNVASETT